MSNAYFGTAVVLDGLTRLVGAKGDSGARGAVYLHEAVPVDDPDDPPIPAYPATGEVTNDSILEDPSGVILGAVESAALDTLPVWIHEIPAPEEPMFDGAIPVGDYYNVGAVVTTPMPSDTPFAVALPVPDEVDPDRLTLAALVSSDDVLDDVSAGMFWIPVTGTYDVENGLYVVVMAALSIEGSTIVLIEHPELATAQPRSAPALRSSVGNSGNFEVNCYIPDCEETMQRTLDQLELAYAEYQKSFPFGPNLMKGKWELCGVKFCSMHVVDVFTGINLFREARTNAQSPCTGGDALTYAALYTALFSTINFCIEAKNHTPEHFDATVSHELFHAYQLSLGPVFDQYNLFKYQEWILEATATAAAGSLTPAVSPPGSRIARDWTHPRHDIRRIDFSFTAPPDIVNNYEAQDFWVHQGQYRNRDLGFLRDMIEQGVTAENIDNQFQLLFGSSLGDEYWRWVKNQLMLEDDIDFSFESNVGPMPAPLGEPPCQIQPKVVKHDETTMSLMLDHTLSVDQAIAHTTTLALLPLQSNVVEITFNAGTTSPVKISVTGLGHKHKVYLDQPTDVDNAACRDVKNGDREINGPLPPGAKAYVLVSNTLVPTNNFWPEKKSTYEVHVDFEG